MSLTTPFQEYIERDGSVPTKEQCALLLAEIDDLNERLVKAAKMKAEIVDAYRKALKRRAEVEIPLHANVEALIGICDHLPNTVHKILREMRESLTRK